ncbi:restriction endonuclease subunit S, partial [Tetragenococcus halophilus]|uniref:restriction endonuclease subunit S n=1 Tax=Tetragenococcus halophilus TaxID=51669 RepID=UPI0015E1923E
GGGGGGGKDTVENAIVICPNCMKRIWNSLEGSTIKRLYNKDLLDLNINTPSTEEQQKIGDFFSKLDRQIELEEKKLDLLEEQKKGYMQKIFSQDLRFKDDNGNDYPEWKEFKLKDVFFKKKGKGLSKNKLDLDGKYQCLLYGELYTHYKEVINGVFSRTNEWEGVLSLKNDLLFPNSTTTNAWDLATFSCFKQENVLLGGDITILRPRHQDIESVFFAYYLSNYDPLRKIIASYGQGITIVHLYFNHIKDVIINLPNIEEQQKIGYFFNNLDHRIELQSQKIESLKTQKQGFLQKMFV